MSRRAMKKTLERLQKTAFQYLKNYEELRIKTQGTRFAAKDNNTARSIEEVVSTADYTVGALYDYVRALEDAYSELAEPLDKKLEAMEEAIKNIGKGAQKKPSYRV